QRKVNFTGRLSLKELSGLTPAADLGLSVEEDLGLNYRFALPNKLFDYIQAHVPVLVTNLPEMATIVEQYQIGEICDSLEPEKLAKSLQEALHNEKKRKTWKENLKIAAEELNWEKEEKILIDIYSPLL
ncbi:MAG: glycosyltransferase, partial [Prolixibacteraceae bacterium]